MRRTLTTALTCAAIAGAMLGASGAQAQMGMGGGGLSGFGQGRSQQPQKKEEYVPRAKAQEKIFPLGETWTAVSLNGKAFTGGDRPSFIIDNQYRARGFGGCNTFAATAFPLREQRLAVGPLALSKKSCDKALSASEQAFLIALRTSGVWDIVGSQLVIKSQNGELRFDRQL